MRGLIICCLDKICIAYAINRGDIIRKSSPCIQIIIPVYNAATYLEKCPDSVLAQTFTDWQALIVNDASTDESARIIERYAKRDKRFMSKDIDQKSGAAAARNTALKMLSAKYTAFLDSDDTWEKDMLKTLYEKAEEYSCDVAQCRYMYDFPNGRTAAPKGAFKKDMLLNGRELRKVYMKMMTGISMNHVCIKLIRADLLDGLSFDTSLRTAEDLNFALTYIQEQNHIILRIKYFTITQDVKTRLPERD